LRNDSRNHRTGNQKDNNENREIVLGQSFPFNLAGSVRTPFNLRPEFHKFELYARSFCSSTQRA
jgi:hypothetical protein